MSICMSEIIWTIEEQGIGGSVLKITYEGIDYVRILYPGEVIPIKEFKPCQHSRFID